MATSINSYSVGFGMDAKDYIDGAKISRTETRKLIKDIEAARTPTEDFAREQDRLTKALNSGAISEQTYSRLLDAKREKMEAANSSMEKHVPLMERLSQIGNILTGVRNAVAMVGDVIQPIRDLWREFDNVAERLDDANDKAHKLGVTFNDMGSLTFAAERLGGADAAAALDKALGQMLKKGMVEPGESAAQAFMRVADEVQRAATQSERAKIASEAFGKSGIELLAVLQSGSAEIGNLVDNWTRFNGLTEAQIEGIGQYNDRWHDVQRAVDGLTSQVVAELAPALTLIANDVLSFLHSLKASGVSTRDVVDSLIVGASMTAEMAENILRMATAAPLIASGQISAAVDLLSGIEDPVTKARDAIVAVYEERKRLQNESIKLDNQQIEDVVDSAEQMADAHIRLFEEHMQALEDQFSSAAQNAIQQAHQYFEQENQRAKKLRDDAGRSPTGMEIGSAEYVKYQADLQNRNRSMSGVPQNVGPTDEQIAQKSAEILKENQKQNLQLTKQVEVLRQLVDIAKENGFRRVR